MKPLRIAAAALLSISATAASAGSDYQRTDGPCFHVSVQNQPENRSRVRQACDWNYSRTVQAGRRNLTHTIQQGRINDNQVRQYGFDSARYFAYPRGR